jgi:anti-anti-sigma factor
MLRGELDADSAPVLSTALLRLYHTDCPTITVDLSAVTFMGAAGLTVLLHIHNLLNIDDRVLILHRPSRVVRRILEVTGLDEILPITSEIE